MLLRIDHLVVAVPDPDLAAAEIGRILGLSFGGGGRHEAMGTYNRLAWLGDTYLELIGVFDRGLVEATGGRGIGAAAMRALDAGRPGLVTWAVATDDIAGDVAALRAAGSSLPEPVDGERTRPDGEVVRWRIAAGPLGPGEPPFLIEHEPAGAEWGGAARAARAAQVHPIGSRARVATLELPVADPAATAAAHGLTVGIRYGRSAGGGTALEGTTAAVGVATLEARVGEQAVRLVGATGETDRPATVEIRLLERPRQGAVTREVELVGVRWRFAS